MTDDLIDKLKKLGELRDSGVLDQTEFEAMKKSLLAGLTPAPNVEREEPVATLPNEAVSATATVSDAPKKPLECAKCGWSGTVNDTVCEFCGTELGQPADAGPKYILDASGNPQNAQAAAMKSPQQPSKLPAVLTFMLIVALAIWGGISLISSGHNEQGGFLDEGAAMVDAQQLIEARLKDPSSATFLKKDIVAKQHPFYMVHCSVDAANSFGAKGRINFLVVIEIDNKSGAFKYDKNNCVQKSSDPPTIAEISSMKALNSWPLAK